MVFRQGLPGRIIHQDPFRLHQVCCGQPVDNSAHTIQLDHLPFFQFFSVEGLQGSGLDMFFAGQLIIIIPVQQALGCCALVLFIRGNLVLICYL